jgi:peptidoglycan/xylan/chitin deacetylase (PgdA/CDA1 family)
MISLLFAGILCLTFDDAYWKNWEKALPVFAKYGAKASFFTSGDINAEALASLKKIDEAGHTVGCHSCRHRDVPEFFKNVSGTMYIRQEIKPQKNALASVGINPEFFAYPNNRRDEDTDAQLAFYFKRFRAGCGLSRKDYYSPSNTTSITEFDCAFFPVGELPLRRVMGGIGVGTYYNTDIDDICRGIRRAAERDEVFVLFSHDICANPNKVSMRTEWLEKILATARECGVAVKGFRELGPVEPQRPTGPMLVSLTFDDNIRDHLLVAAPELEKRGWKGVFAIVTDWIGKKENHLSWDEVRELVRRGHEIAVHTRSHRGLGRLADKGQTELVREEISVARDIITRETGVRPRLLCLPGSNYSAMVGTIAREEGLEPMTIPRACCGEGCTDTAKTISAARKNGMLKYDLLVHGVRPEGGGWKPFPSIESFKRHMQAIEDAERAGDVKVVDYPVNVHNLIGR